MGNHCPVGIPALLAKNWQPVPDHANTFQNKLTSEFTHKHIINVEDALEIQSFKYRMKETNMYVCRVLFYHQYHESIYHVYTDEIHLQPTLTKYQLWRIHKIKIIQSFAHLASVYGLTKVCRQMIGADSNGHPKVWIHPDPVCSKLWLPCQSEQVMLTDIINIFNNLEERSNISHKKKLVKSTTIAATLKQYLTFEDYIQSQTLIMNEQIAQLKSKQNRNSSLVENSSLHQKNLSELAVKKINQNKTYAFQYTDNKNKNPSLKQPKPINNSDIQQHMNEMKKNSKLSKLFNPVLCQTSRDEPKEIKFTQFPSYSPIKNEKAHKNVSLERPVTYNFQSPIYNSKKNYDLSQKINGCQSLSIGKRRQTQKITTVTSMMQKNTQPATKSKVNLKEKKSFQEYRSAYFNNQQRNNPLNQIFIQPQKGLRAGSSPDHVKKKAENKSYQNLLYNPNVARNKPNKSYNQENMTQKIMTQSSKKDMKFTAFPYFLMKSNAEPNKDLMKKQPSTERQTRQFMFLKTEKIQPKRPSNGIYIISSKSLEEDQDIEVESRPIQHTAAQLKEQLHMILDTPIQPEPRPVSLQYENFKSAEMLYHQPNSLQWEYDESQSEKGELDLIKQKVEEKKARFAQLKLDAKKILQDDF